MPTIIPFKTSRIIDYLQQLKKNKPLVHCITNDVVQNFTANILLAVGAVPAMVVAKEEVSDFVLVADSLLINIGTVTATSAQSMLLAANAAMCSKTHWVLDPVAVSCALPYRTDIAQKLLTFRPSVIRGNASEILALANQKSLSKGPDSQDSTQSALLAARQIAIEYHTIVAVTGQIDYVTDGKVIYSISGGDIALTHVTGTGCSLSALVAAFIANTNDILTATATACLVMKTAAEMANKREGIGSFAVSLLDQISLIDLAFGEGQ